MKIELTKNEYRLLLDYMYLGDWIINGHQSDERRDTEEYEMLLQKLYSYAKDMGFEALIDADRDSNKYTPTSYYEETSRVSEFIEEYDNDCFWDVLISRLAERDIYEQVEKEALQSMSSEEYMERTAPVEEAYYREFRRRGLDRLRLVES